MVWRLFGAKPLPTPMLILIVYVQSDTSDYIWLSANELYIMNHKNQLLESAGFGQYCTCGCSRSGTYGCSAISRHSADSVTLNYESMWIINCRVRLHSVHTILCLYSDMFVDNRCLYAVDLGPLLLKRISNRMPGNVWHEITYPFPNVNGCTVEVWEWICKFIPHFMMDVIIYLCR